MRVPTSSALCCVLVAAIGTTAVPKLETRPTAMRRPGKLFSAGDSRLRKHDRSRLSEARAQGKAEVTLLIASAPGANETVASEITSAGGSIRYRADDVSYVRAILPSISVERIAQSDNVQVVSLDGFPDYYSGLATKELESQESNVIELSPAPGRDTPAENPYLPTRDIGAPQFVKAHPTFDGRGVTIAVIEDIPDLLSPEFQTATNIDGQTVCKIAEINTSVDPLEEDVFRVKMGDTVSAENGVQFMHNKIPYTAPADGTFRIGIFDATPRPGTDLPFPYTHFSSFQKINLGNNPPGRGRLFAVLWNELTNSVWVDTNQNYSFADEKPMTDYNLRKDVNVFGKDDVATPVRDTMGFVVFTNAERKYVTIGLGSGSHTSGVASAAAGKNFFGGRMSGAAPEAQLVIVKTALVKNYSPIEGMILAIRNPKVDLATISWGLVMRQNDGNNIVDVVFDRLIERYKKPIITGTQNGGPAINTAFDCTDRAIIVGGYIHRDTWRANYGLVSDKVDYVSNITSRGPRDDGAFKPDILAPVDAVMVANGVFPSFTAGNAFKLPPGYQQTWGTSFAGPIAAGGTALLISAAKQLKVKYDAERVKLAIKAGARFLPDFGAHEQGAGLLNVGAAWEALKRQTEPVEIESIAPVNTVLSRYLKEPNHGPGIYEREGWTPGQTGQRAITFVRQSGPSKTITYDLSWVGNDGTFTSPTTISLPLRKPVKLSVGIHPKSAAAHSALLNLVDRDTAAPIYGTMNTVVAAETLIAANNFVYQQEGKAEFLSWKSYFLYVPAGAAAFKVDMKVSYGNVKLNFFDPSGTSYFTSHPRTPGKGLVQYQEGGTWSRAFPNPEPGVWEVVIINENYNRATVRLKQQPPTTFTFSAQVLGVEFPPGTIDVSPNPQESERWRVNLANRLGTFKGKLSNTPLGSAFSDLPVLTSNGQPRIYDIDVPSGTSSLNVRIGKASDRSADLDIYLYDCTGERCIAMAHSVGVSSEEFVTVINPITGRWKALVDPFAVPSGQTTCEYLEVFTHDLFGSVISSNGYATRALRAKWTEEISAHVRASPTGARYLMSVLTIQAEEVNSINYRIGEPALIKPVTLGTSFRRLEYKRPRRFAK